MEFPLLSKASEVRKPETKDLAKRLIYFKPSDVSVNNYPISRPLAFFNPTFVVKDDSVYLIARATFGYFSYANVLVQAEFPLEMLYSKQEQIFGHIILIPDNEFDFFGLEDPRIYNLNSAYFMTYTGRTAVHGEGKSTPERATCITAASDDLKNWKKRYVHRLEEPLRSRVESNKNAFIVNKEGHWLFHRIRTTDDKFYLVLSRLNLEDLPEGLSPVFTYETVEVMKPLDEEHKIGWNCYLELNKHELLILLHGVGKKIKAYRVFACIFNTEEWKVASITSNYIMQPETVYEKYGDRPHVVFPCGMQLLDDKLIISYGGADTFTCFSEITLDELLSFMKEVD